MSTDIKDCNACFTCLTGKRDAFGVPLTLSRMIVCSTCGNKRCPKATDHQLDCTGSNEPGQAGSRYVTTVLEVYAERDKLRAFAQDIMEGWPDVGTLDGFDLQELAVKHGLLAETTHHKPCAEEGCNCASMVDERDWKEGVQCYRATALLKPSQMV